MTQMHPLSKPNHTHRSRIQAFHTQFSQWTPRLVYCLFAFKMPQLLYSATHKPQRTVAHNQLTPPTCSVLAIGYGVSRLGHIHTRGGLPLWNSSLSNLDTRSQDWPSCRDLKMSASMTYSKPGLNQMQAVKRMKIKSYIYIYYAPSNGECTQNNLR